MTDTHRTTEGVREWLHDYCLMLSRLQLQPKREHLQATVSNRLSAVHEYLRLSAEQTANLGPREPNNDMVICPNCTCQFVAIPVNVQKRLSGEPATEELQRLRHYVATCGGTDNNGRCPMRPLAGLAPEPRDDEQWQRTVSDAERYRWLCSLAPVRTPLAWDFALGKYKHEIDALVDGARFPETKSVPLPGQDTTGTCICPSYAGSHKPECPVVSTPLNGAAKP